MTKRPRFSVIVPTRERAETLGFCLETCIEQNYDDFEIVVCDNCSSKETKEVVDRINSPRIIYHRSPTPLTMAENWSLAYSISNGEYIIFIGDDDGLMPYALFQLDRLIHETGLSGIYWNPAAYAWPSLARSDMANYLTFGYIPNFHIYNGRTVIRDVLSGHASEHVLPNIYHGLTSRTIIETIRTQKGKIAVGHGPGHLYKLWYRISSRSLYARHAANVDKRLFGEECHRLFYFLECQAFRRNRCLG